MNDHNRELHETERERERLRRTERERNDSSNNTKGDESSMRMMLVKASGRCWRYEDIEI